MDRSFLTEFKRKRMVMEEEYHMVLILKIHSSEGIDTQTTDPNGDKRICSVLGCVNHIKNSVLQEQRDFYPRNGMEHFTSHWAS
ncbi:hypothetical protein LguiB_001708 [Lonicera macranthoides]